jgi:hypothetical protein
MKERTRSHGGAFWRKEFPLMVAWMFGREQMTFYVLRKGQWEWGREII